ncbi:MAG TPA: hypothetical protein VFB54_18900 [Burkholderiales bacterium]|nr:hypothetical protein [Burkholderiales bacterium]
MASDERAAMIENIEMDLFLLGLERAFGLEFGDAPRRTVRQAILDQVRAEQAVSVTALLDRALHDTDCGQRIAASVLRDTFELFACPPFFRALHSQVIPWLRTCPFVNVWVSEPPSPGDVYALAILLSEAALYARTRIYVTYRDATRLRWSREAVVSARALELSAPRYRLAGGIGSLGHYFEAHDADELAPAAQLRANVVWSQYDIGSGAPFHEFNLIVCRSDARYSFQSAKRRTVHLLLTDSLALFGILALAPHQPPDRAFANRYRLLDAEAGLYQRVR